MNEKVEQTNERKRDKLKETALNSLSVAIWQIIDISALVYAISFDTELKWNE